MTRKKYGNTKGIVKAILNIVKYLTILFVKNNFIDFIVEFCLYFSSYVIKLSKEASYSSLGSH